MSSIGAVALLSIKAVGALLIQYIVGAVAGYRGIVTPEQIQSFASPLNVTDASNSLRLFRPSPGRCRGLRYQLDKGRALVPLLAQAILIPCLIVTSLGKGLRYEVFVTEGWVLAVAGFASSWESALLGLGLRRLARPHPEFSRLFLVMMMVPNVVAIPMSLSETLCIVGAYAEEFGEDTAACVERSRAYVFLFCSLNAVNIWGFALSYLKGQPQHVAATSAPVDVADNDADAPTEGPRALTPTDPSQVVAAGVDGPKAGEPAFARPRLSRALTRSLTAAGRAGVTVSTRPPIVATGVGLVIGLLPVLQQALFAPDAALRVVGLALEALTQPTVPLVNLMLAVSLGHKLRGVRSCSHLLGSTEIGISRRTLGVLTVGRMVIDPLVFGSLVYALLPVLPPGRLFRSLLLIEMAPPTASIVIVLAMLAHQPKLAQLGALAIVPQYFVAIFTLTFVILVALQL